MPDVRSHPSGLQVWIGRDQPQWPCYPSSLLSQRQNRHLLGEECASHRQEGLLDFESGNVDKDSTVDCGALKEPPMVARILLLLGLLMAARVYVPSMSMSPPICFLHVFVPSLYIYRLRV